MTFDLHECALRIDAFAASPSYLPESEFALRECSFKPESVVLDLGCGTGRLARHLGATRNAFVVGIDTNIEALRIALGHHSNTYSLYAGAHLPFKSQAFDLVVCSHVIGHVEDPVLVMSETWRVLKPCGTLLIMTPNRLYARIMQPWNRVRSYQPDPTLLRLYSSRNLCKLLRRGGFEVRNVGFTGAWPPGLACTRYDPLRSRLVVRAIK